MKLVKTCFIFILFVLAFSACERQDVWTVNDIVDGTASRADTVLPHKFKKHDVSDSLRALRKEENLLPEFKR